MIIEVVGFLAVTFAAMTIEILTKIQYDKLKIDDEDANEIAAKLFHVCYELNYEALKKHRPDIPWYYRPAIANKLMDKLKAAS